MLRLLLSLAAAMALAVPVPAQEAMPLARSWQAEHGLPSNTIRWIAQTRDNFMWLGTEAGLARFDGLHFVAYGPKDGLPADAVYALQGTKDGALWVGYSDAGLVRLKNNAFTIFSKDDDLPSLSIRALSEGPDGTLWVGTPKGVARWNGSRFEAIPNPPGRNGMTALIARRNGEVWVHFYGRSLEVWNGKTWTSPPSLPPGGLDNITGFAEDAEGRLWAVSNAGPAVRLGLNGWESFPFVSPPATPLPRPIAVGPRGEVCIGHLGAGLWVLKGKSFVPLSTDDGSGEALVEGVHYDLEGQLWVGSFSSGLVRLSPRRVESLRFDPTNNADPVRSIAEVNPGEIWAGTQGIGFWRWADGKTSRIVPDSSMRWEIYGNGLARNHAGSLFVATDTVRRFDAGKLSGSWNLGNPARETVRSLCVAPDDALYVGTAGGRLLELRNGAMKLLAASNKSGSAWSLTLTPDQALWASTAERGARRLKAGTDTFFTAEHGLRSNRVNAMHTDARGTLWAGTRGGGLARWNGERFQSIGTEAGLLDDTITQIMDDAHGRLWLGGIRGLSSLPIAELEAAFAGKIPSVHPRNFSRADGMDSSEFLEMQPIRDSQGRLYFGTTRGIVRVDPRPADTSPSPPRIYLKSLTADDQHRFDAADSHWPERVTLPPGTARIEVAYTAPEFVAPEQLRFRYHMSGIDEQWHPVGDQRAVSFTRLPPGHYRFEVSAAEPGGGWIAPAAMEITLLPFFWQTGWFLALCYGTVFLLIGILIWAILKRRAAREVARLEKEHALDAERARIAKDLHDDLGASMTQIALFSDLAKSDLGSPEQATEHLEQIFLTARKSARALDEIIWAVNPARDSLEGFATYLSKQVQDLARASGLACYLDLPNPLPPLILPAAIRHHLFLAAREALHNIAKHAGAKTVSMKVSLNVTTFRLVIEDNGRGMIGATDTEDADGLRNMQRRMSEIGGRFHIDAPPDGGTRVTFELPLRVFETNQAG